MGGSFFSPLSSFSPVPLSAIGLGMWTKKYSLQTQSPGISEQSIKDGVEAERHWVADSQND